MSQNLKKQHFDLAQHNEQACDFLNGNNKFFDWVITSAFYSALHYVNSVIFPIEYEHRGQKRMANDISAYRSYLESQDNKHKVMSDLVYNKCHGIGSSYRALLDLSFAARYETDCQDKLYSNRARIFLEQIKTHCINAYNGSLPPSTKIIKAPRTIVSLKALTSNDEEDK